MRKQRGANAIEMALTFPFFVVLMAGMMDLGWMLFSTSVVDMAANRGCRAGALVDPVEQSPVPVARQSIDQWLAFLGSSCEQASCGVAVEGRPPEMTVVCEVQVPAQPLWGLFVQPSELRQTAMVHLEIQRKRQAGAL